MIPVATHSGNHHFIARRLLSSQAFVRVDKNPKELFGKDKRQDWARIFKAHGQDDAVNFIDWEHSLVYAKVEQAMAKLTTQDNDVRKNAEQHVQKCIFHRDEDKAAR